MVVTVMAIRVYPKPKQDGEKKEIYLEVHFDLRSPFFTSKKGDESIEDDWKQEICKELGIFEIDPIFCSSSSTKSQ